MIKWYLQKAMKFVKIEQVPLRSNIIGSYVVYKLKLEVLVKAQFVTRGDFDAETHFLQTDSKCINIDVFRFILSIAAKNLWNIGETDISAEFLRADFISRLFMSVLPLEKIAVVYDPLILDKCRRDSAYLSRFLSDHIGTCDNLTIK